MNLLNHYPDMLTVLETAEILRTAPATVNDLIRVGKIICAEIAGKTLIPKQYLENFIEKKFQDML